VLIVVTRNHVRFPGVTDPPPSPRAMGFMMTHMCVYSGADGLHVFAADICLFWGVRTVNRVTPGGGVLFVVVAGNHVCAQPDRPPPLSSPGGGASKRRPGPGRRRSPPGGNHLYDLGISAAA